MDHDGRQAATDTDESEAMSNKQEIKVPDIGGGDKVSIIEVLVSEGDEVEREQSLITLESDKATMEVPSSVAGTIVELMVREGGEVGEGDVIAVVEAAGEASDSPSAEEQAETAPDEAGEDDADKAGEQREEPSQAADDDRPEDGQAQRPPAGDSDDLPPPPIPYEAMGEDPSKIPHASPAIRRLAPQLGVGLSQVSGSGRKGRITDDGRKGRVNQVSPAGGPAAGGLHVAAAPQVDFAKYGEIEEVTLSRVQQISGPALHRNWVSIPHVTQFDQADITEMEAFRQASKSTAEQAGTRMTPLVFLIKAVVAALREFPHFNASLAPDGKTLVMKKYYHVGVAVDTDNGLLVPVIRDCDKKGLIELARELTDLSERARAGKLKADEMRGGCFSISSLGGIGGTAFTPIINAPELAILGVSRSEMAPVWNGEAFEPRLMLPLSLSYDHRVIDGADAVRFTRYLAAQLEDLRRLLL